MDPAHHGLRLPPDLPRPFTGVAVLAGDHVQRLETFAAALMLSLHPQALEIGQRLIPFRKVWFDHASSLSGKLL